MKMLARRKKAGCDQLTQPWSLLHVGTPIFTMWRGAARDGDPDLLPQPPDPPSGGCDLVCLSAPERHPGPRDV